MPAIMWLYVRATMCSVLYLLVACETSIFADSDPVSSIRAGLGLGVVEGLYAFCACMSVGQVLRVFGLRMVFGSVLMTVLCAAWIVQYVVLQQNTVVGVLCTQLRMVAGVFRMQHEDWERLIKSAWSVLRHSACLSDMAVQLYFFAIKFSPFSSPVPSNTCFVFCTVLCAQYAVQLWQQLAPETHNE